MIDMDATQERLVRQAIALARATLPAQARPSEIVFRIFEDMAWIHTRMRVKGDPKGLKAAWPFYVHTVEEREDAAKQRRVDEAAGDVMLSPEIWGVTLTATPAEITMMDVVNSVFRPLLAGHTQARDWRLLHLFAVGYTSRRAAREMNISHSRAADRKKLQCSVIASKLSHLFESPRVLQAVAR